MDLFSGSFDQALLRLENSGGDDMPPWLRPVQQDAARRFMAQGLPTIRHEDWKYTNLVPLSKRSFHVTAYDDRETLSADAYRKIRLSARCKYRAVVVNGGFRPDLSNLESLAPGLQVYSIRAASAAGRGDEANTLERSQVRDSALTDLNTAFLHDALIVKLDEDVSVPDPLHLIFIGSGGAYHFLRLPRVIIQAHRNCSIRIIEEYVSEGHDQGLTNAVTEIALHEGATVHHHRLQVESTDAAHIGRIYATAAGNSRFLSDSVSFGGSLARIDVDVALAGQGASCRLNGLFVAGGEQHVDHHTRIDHVVGNTHSDELYRGIIDERGRGVFNGKVIVRKNAQQISARQTSNNLLLSRHAEIDTKPQLEIYADDVTCAHGATVGELDTDALFYLRSRGMSEEGARALLIYAFAERVVEDIPVEGIRRWIENRFIHGGGYRDFMEALTTA